MRVNVGVCMCLQKRKSKKLIYINKLFRFEVHVELSIVATGCAKPAGTNPRLPGGLVALRFVSHDSDALNDTFADKVIQDKMLGTTIIPYCNRAFGPVVSYGEPRVGDPFR